MGQPTKRVKLQEIMDLRGNPFGIPDRDARGNVTFKGRECKECGRPLEVVTKDTTDLRDLIEEMAFYRIQVSRETPLSRADAIKQARLYEYMEESRKADDGVLAVSNDIHDWVRALLKDDKVGVVTFRANIEIVEEAWDNFERAHEPAEKPKE